MSEPERDDMQEIADVLWPTTTTATPQTPARQQPAAASVPTEEVLYGHGQLERVVTRRASDLWTELNLTEARQRGLVDQYVGLTKGTGLNEGVIARVAALHLDRELAAARRQRAEGSDAEDARLAQQYEQDNITAREGVRGRYGQDAHDLLARAHRFVQSHPSLATMLQQHGIGSDPTIVMELCQHVLRSGFR